MVHKHHKCWNSTRTHPFYKSCHKISVYRNPSWLNDQPSKNAEFFHVSLEIYCSLIKLAFQVWKNKIDISVWKLIISNVAYMIHFAIITQDQSAALCLLAFIFGFILCFEQASSISSLTILERKCKNLNSQIYFGNHFTAYILSLYIYVSNHYAIHLKLIRHKPIIPQQNNF